MTSKGKLFMLQGVTRRKLYNFYIDDDLAEALKRLKDVEREPEAAIVRRALRQYLDARGVLKAAKPARGKRTGKA